MSGRGAAPARPGEVFVPRPPPPAKRSGASIVRSRCTPWPPEPYVPGASGVAGPDDELARLLLERRSGAATGRGADLLPTRDPELRARLLARLEEELRAGRPELLVAAGGRSRLALVLADRTGLPLLDDVSGLAQPGEGTSSEIDALLRDSRVALVGERLRASGLADRVRTLERTGARVVAILGIAGVDGGEMEMLANHYNVFCII